MEDDDDAAVVVAATTALAGGLGTRVATTGAALDFLDAIVVVVGVVSSGFLNEISVGVLDFDGVLRKTANSSSTLLAARDNLVNGSLLPKLVFSSSLESTK